MPTAIPMAELRQGDDPQQLPEGVSDTAVYIEGNDGLAVIEVHNPTGGDLTVLPLATLTIGGISAAGATVAIPAGQTCWLPPLPPAVYNDLSGNAYLSAAAALIFSGLRF